MRIFIAILCGLLFGAGMIISDMVNPARVLDRTFDVVVIEGA